MTTNNTPLFEGLTEEQAKQLAEAANKAGIRPKELEGFVHEKLPRVISAVSEVFRTLAETVAEMAAGFARLASQYGIGLEEQMKEVATPKEWHLMNHAKKFRTRKKYRNRLIKRVAKKKGADT